MPKPSSIMPRRANAYRTLPAEIWSQICSYMDDLTLWIVFRQVSRTVRSEAERNFATTRLHYLELDWTCRSTFSHPDHDYSLELDCYTKNCMRKFMGLTGDGARARFHVPVHCKVQGVEGDYVANQQKFYPIVNCTVSQALRDIDIRIHNDGKFAKINTVLDDFSNNNHLPGVQYSIETEECSFDWKSFLNLFYADYMLVERIKHPQSPYACVAARNEVTEVDFERQLKHPVLWHKTYRRLEDPLFEHAHLVRLKRARVEAGLQFSLSEETFEEIKEEVVRLRWKRCYNLYMYLSSRQDMRDLAEERMRRGRQQVV